MGIISSKLQGFFHSYLCGTGRPAIVLMLGLDNAGKTTILYQVKLNEQVTTLPTIDYNVETVPLGRGGSLTVWDVGGQAKLRHIWQHYYQDTQGLLFVVDSTDLERLPEVKEELHRIFDDESCRQIPFVVIANKQDLPGALSPDLLIEALSLPLLSSKHRWTIQAACGLTGEGLHQAMESLSELISPSR